MSLDPNFERLEKREQQLQNDKARLIENRKRRVGELAERFHLLTVSDQVLAGLFSELSEAVKGKDARLKSWEAQGARFCSSSRSKKLEEVVARES